MSTHGSSDDELARAWKAGDRAAGKDLVQRYYLRINAFFRNAVGDEDASDLAHDTFARLAEALEKQRELLAFRPFLYGIARNVLLGFYRNKYRKKNEFDPLVDTIEDIDGVGQSELVGRVLKASALLTLIRALPIDEKELLEVYYWHGLTAREVGEAFGISEATVRTRVHKVVKRLRKELREHDGHVSEDEDLAHRIVRVGRLVQEGPLGRSEIGPAETNVITLNLDSPSLDLVGHVYPEDGSLELFDFEGRVATKLDIRAMEPLTLVLHDTDNCEFFAAGPWERHDDTSRSVVGHTSGDDYQEIEVVARATLPAPTTVRGTLELRFRPPADGAAVPTTAVTTRELLRVSLRGEYSTFADFAEVVAAIEAINGGLASRGVLDRSSIRLVGTSMSSPVLLEFGVVMAAPTGPSALMSTSTLAPVLVHSVWRCIEAWISRVEENVRQEQAFTELMANVDESLAAMGRRALDPEAASQLATVVETMGKSAALLRRKRVSLRVGPISLSRE